HRGPTDAVYENAMHNYKNRLYTPAIPSLTQTLKLYPGHALAEAQLADANKKKGTAEEATAPSTPERTASNTSTSLWYTVVWVAIGVMALLVAVLAFLLIRRRGRRRPKAAGFNAPRQGGGPDRPADKRRPSNE